jgi:hypothetical protein
VVCDPPEHDVTYEDVVEADEDDDPHDVQDDDKMTLHDGHDNHSSLSDFLVEGQNLLFDHERK